MHFPMSPLFFYLWEILHDITVVVVESWGLPPSAAMWHICLKVKSTEAMPWVSAPGFGRLHKLLLLSLLIGLKKNQKKQPPENSFGLCTRLLESACAKITLKFIAALFKPKALIYITVWYLNVFDLLSVRCIFGFSNMLRTVWPAFFFFPHLVQGSSCLQSKKRMGTSTSFQSTLWFFLRRGAENHCKVFALSCVVQGSCTGGLQWWELCFLGSVFSIVLM